MTTAPAERTLHSVAEQWASTKAEIKRKEDELRRAETDFQNLRNYADTLADQLLKRVGPNQTTLVFQVTHSEVVLVEHGKPVRILEVTPTDKR